jgi:hypothetical protein
VPVSAAGVERLVMVRAWSQRWFLAPVKVPG